MLKFIWQLFRPSRPQVNIFNKKVPTERHLFDRFQWNGGRLLSRKELDIYNKTVKHREKISEVSE